MTATILKLLPDDEIRILENYINNKWSFGLEEVFDTLGVPNDPNPDRIAVAVAQILLNPIQDSLPNWASVGDDGTVNRGRLPHHRHKDARLQFNPLHVCTINWGDTGPGFSWPEAYHVTYLPSFDKHIVTASRDSQSAWGCLDHAIGVVDGKFSAVKAAELAIISYWTGERDCEWGVSRWEYLFCEGLINKATANAWSDEVWPEEPAEDEDEYEQTTQGVMR